MSASKIGLGVAAGYLLGRTKKMKLAITVGSMLAGQRIATNPIGLLKQAGELVDKNPELKKLQDRITGELFDAARLKIDIGRRQISVVSRADAPAGIKLPLTAHAGIESIPVLANGTEAQAEFDLGNGSDVMISRDLARKLKLRVIGKKSGGGIGGAIDRDLVRLDTLDVAGKRFRNVVAAIDDQESHNDMNIGTAILKNFRITTDFKARAVWLDPVGKVR